MRSKIFSILIILIFSTKTFGSTKDVLNLSKVIEKDFIHYAQNIENYIVNSHEDENTYFLPFERRIILKNTKKLLSSISKLDQFGANKVIRVASKKRSSEYDERILAKVLKYNYLSRFFHLSFYAGNAFTTVLSEGAEDINFKGKKVRKLFTKTLTQARVSYSRSQNKKGDINQLAFPRVADFIQFNEKVIKNRNFDKLEKELYQSSLEEFLANIKAIKKLKSSVTLKNGSYSPLYYLKVIILKGASYLALPGKHKISLETLKEVDHKLSPGDIGLIQRYNKLSNIVFKGNWTHSLLYIGAYSKLREYFDYDEETNQFYTIKCLQETLPCQDFIGYLHLKYPKKMKRYYEGQFANDPIVTIESLKPGVILYPMGKSMAWDNLVLLRPRLSKKDKAMAIETAFSNIGKPYDYNFDGRTDERLVCTEVISHTYAPNPLENKGGLTWKVSTVSGRPVMYAYDILKTFFERENTPNQELDIILYIRGEKGNYGKSRDGDYQELRDSVYF